jgi:hypothetical protein
MTPQLSASQHAILAHAIHHTEGRLSWFPDKLKGGARKQVIDALSNRALITRDGVHWCVAAEGYDALGMPRPAPARGPITLAALDACIAAGEAAQHGAGQVLAGEAGGEVPTDAEIDTSNEIDAAVTAIGTSARAEIKMPRTRDNSKQAQVIAMLQRPEGATIAQICEATSWQSHTVRGTFAGSFKKKLGLTIDSSKESGGERVYRIAG